MAKNIIFDKKNVLITGGAGFIGSHLCDELVKTCKVICLDNFSTGSEANIDHLLANSDFEFIRHDISEPINLEKLPELQKFKIEFQGIQEVYHLACPTSPKAFEKNIINTLLANSIGVKNVLDLALKYNAKLIHFSSSVVYGTDRSFDNKIVENDVGKVDILSDRSCYDEGKRFAETIVYNYKKAYGLDAKIIRLFRIYGPRMPLNEGHMIPDFISDAIDNKDLTIFGDENFTTSFCYVNDCIDAVLKVADSDFFGPINIGSDVPVRLADLAEKIICRVGAKSRIRYEKPIQFMSQLSLPDINRAKIELGWMPIITIDKGLELTIYELRAAKGLKVLEASKQL